MCWGGEDLLRQAPALHPLITETGDTGSVYIPPANFVRAYVS